MSSPSRSHIISFILAVCLMSLMLLPTKPVQAGTLTVDTLANENDGSCSDGDCSLVDAVQTAVSGDTIQFSVTGTIPVASAIILNKNLTINGPGAASLSLSGQTTTRIFQISSSKEISISGLSIINGNAMNGGGISNEGSLTISDCVFSANTASNDGGAIYNTGTLTVNNCTFNTNTAPSAGGGAIKTTNSPNVTISNSNFTENSATWGGALEVMSSTATVTGCTFTDNDAVTSGGAISNDTSGSLTVTNSTFSGNEVTGSGLGGGINSLKATSLEISKSTFTNNNAKYGGAVYIRENTNPASITNSSFDSNDASSYGGGIYILISTLTLSHSTLSWNGAPGAGGGGLYNASSGRLNLINTILANSAGGSDCLNVSGTIDTNTNNLAETGNCLPAFTDDPNLDTLKDNGGATQTMALLAGSPAIDAGGAACPDTDQREVKRPQGSGCDIGSFEVDVVPSVVDITLADPNPTSTTSVDFTVTFSEDVLNVDPLDFHLSKTGTISGEAVTGISGTGTTYTVSADTGTGSGTLRLDLPDSASINDPTGNPLSGLPYAGGDTYDVEKSLTVRSQGVNDGWILESTESSNAGGTMDAVAGILRLGDNASRKQYRSILSFETGSLPNNAVITKVTLKIKKQGITGGGAPVADFQGIKVDIKQGIFGTAGLQLSDFRTAASKTCGPFTPAEASGWYTLNLTSGKNYINKLATGNGLTQMRLRFALDDNNNAIANYLSLYSGNAGTVANRPQLIIEYYVP